MNSLKDGQTELSAVLDAVHDKEEIVKEKLILIPDSTRAPVVARHLLRGIKPFAILLPTVNFWGELILKQWMSWQEADCEKQRSWS